MMKERREGDGVGGGGEGNMANDKERNLGE